MELFFAPLEGITSYIYRNAHNEIFGGCDSYFAPFITPSENERVSIKSLRDIVPEKNKGINLVPQTLINTSEAFFHFEERIKEVGFSEVNLNFGCPSGTVVKKDRGAGFLRFPERLDRVLYEIFEKTSLNVSVKTRIGFDSGDEMEKLMEIYNKYPLKLLIIHPRARANYYNGEPNMECFKKAYSASKNDVCYNGDIFSKEDFLRIKSAYPELKSAMLGRGAVINPALFRVLRGGDNLKTYELVRFLKKLSEDYFALLNSDRYTLNKMKEIGLYVMKNFPNEKKITKAIKKANFMRDFLNAVECLPELKY